MKVRIWVVGDRAPLEMTIDELMVYSDDDEPAMREQEILVAAQAGKGVLLVNPDALVALEASP